MAASPMTTHVLWLIIRRLDRLVTLNRDQVKGTTFGNVEVRVVGPRKRRFSRHNPKAAVLVLPY